MAYQVIVTSKADRSLRSLPSQEEAKIRRAISSLSANPRPHGVVKLVGSTSDYRIRVGNYRVVYEVSDAIRVVEVYDVDHRKNIYKR